MKQRGMLGGGNHEGVHSRETEAKSLGMVLINEFKFPHCIFLLGKNELNQDGCKYGYDKMCKFLKLGKNQSQGFTLILAQEWMFLAPIVAPYHHETRQDINGAKFEQGVPVYLDGFAYSGLVNVQNIVQQWPATADIGFEKHSVLSALET